MNVSWVTTSRSTAAKVVYGLAPDNLSNSNVGQTVWYSFASAANLSYSSPGLHHATMVDLRPSTTYYYQVGDNASLSEIFSFQTLPAGGYDAGSSKWNQVSFAVIGDLGQTDNSAATVANIISDNEIQAIVHVGDMSYADTDQDRWDSYGRKIQKLSARLPWMVAVGNHEIESDTVTGGGFVPYQHRFNMPAVAPPVLRPNTKQIGCVYSPVAGQADCTPSVFMGSYSYGNSFFSYDIAGAHVIVLNPYTPTNATSPQGRWLRQDLQAYSRAKTPWLFVVTHCPVYNSNAYHRNEAQAVEQKANLESVWLSYGVDVVMAGHVHAYERISPVADDQLQPEGVTYLNVGAGGNREGHATPFEYPSPEWSAFRDDEHFGHGKMVLVNETHAHWTWYSNDSGDAEPIDEVWLVRRFKGNQTFTVHVPGVRR